ncbi:rho family-interacting cell polarization regulator 2 isoform X5 [Hemicordylus capensis]|uniref:rho family-interacting cell polarization regulator 2 isoform X5 n=1 Tax=Hemicordylus capensis TaxID=884348 RepID=UPI00230476BA|nr:rho family-interacting cell polarization regulator 2 isoform X5 [Hemicordylus capensis]
MPDRPKRKAGGGGGGFINQDLDFPRWAPDYARGGFTARLVGRRCRRLKLPAVLSMELPPRRVRNYRPWRRRTKRWPLSRLPSRLPEIMSVGSHSFSPGGPNGIIRSQSFAGFSGLQERRSRCNSFIENSSSLKKPQAKVKKMHNLGYKNNSTSKEPQPERMEEVYKALKNGLDEYLEVHQTELDKLIAQLKDMKRNSRLGVLYDLDKQMKAIERYMRKLEFHISKVDELYEAYCIQRRLRDGANKMKQAFGLSPASKAARESLSEIGKSYKEYTENMCTIEGELENLMGEFCIKMKGLAGFARLCPGDQYEIFMRYGRQRWKLKGKIEVNGKQSWDGEEMIFFPLIVGLISIKVMEVKGLATHILVGSVTCETKDLFAAQRQVVAVDINDLGTIKLNLEITWHPFDVEDITPSTGSTNKAALQRRMSMYSQGTPETPTFKDHSFFCRPAINHSRSSSLSLTVESALESFDFLNTSDFDEDDGATDELCNVGRGADSVFSDTETEKNSYRSEHPEARGHLSEALTEDTGVGTSVAGSPLPLTSGNESLDITIVKHLQYCTQLLQQIVFSNKTPLVTRNLLDKLSQQILVMESLAEISNENMGNIRPISEAIPEFQKRTSLLSFWTKCTSSPGVYHMSADKMVKQLDITFAMAVNEEYPGLSETVFKTLVSYILDRAEPVLPSSLSLEIVTVFQYYNYFASKNISDLGNHLLQLAREALMVQTLQSLREEKFLQNMTALTSISLSPHQEVLKSLALLLLTENKRETCEAVISVLSAAAEDKHFREKALIYYCETLAQPSLHLQKAACLALKCLQATESIKMLVMLCQSDNEEIRKVASETLLSLGEDGRLAYEQLDKFPREFVKVGGRRGTEVATAF